MDELLQFMGRTLELSIESGDLIMAPTILLSQTVELRGFGLGLMFRSYETKNKSIMYSYNYRPSSGSKVHE